MTNLDGLEIKSFSSVTIGEDIVLLKDNLEVKTISIAMLRSVLQNQSMNCVIYGETHLVDTVYNGEDLDTFAPLYIHYFYLNN